MCSTCGHEGVGRAAAGSVQRTREHALPPWRAASAERAGRRSAALVPFPARPRPSIHTTRFCPAHSRAQASLRSHALLQACPCGGWPRSPRPEAFRLQAGELLAAVVSDQRSQAGRGQPSGAQPALAAGLRALASPENKEEPVRRCSSAGARAAGRQGRGSGGAAAIARRGRTAAAGGALPLLAPPPRASAAQAPCRPPAAHGRQLRQQLRPSAPLHVDEISHPATAAAAAPLKNPARPPATALSPASSPLCLSARAWASSVTACERLLVLI